MGNGTHSLPMSPGDEPGQKAEALPGKGAVFRVFAVRFGRHIIIIVTMVLRIKSLILFIKLLETANIIVKER